MIFSSANSMEYSFELQAGAEQIKIGQRMILISEELPDISVLVAVFMLFHTNYAVVFPTVCFFNHYIFIGWLLF